MSIFDFFRKKHKAKNDLKHDDIAKRANVEAKIVHLSLDRIETLKKHFIAIDIETTGLSPALSRIIEIGAVVFENGIATAKFNTYVNAGFVIPDEVTRINHITNSMIQNAPDEKTAIKNFLFFIGDAINGVSILCAHNAEFELEFLTDALKRNDYDAKLIFVDTLSISRRYVHNLTNYKQDTVAHYFGIKNHASHRALSDAEVCGLMMVQLNEIAENDFNNKVLKNELAKGIVPLTVEQIEWAAYIQNQIIMHGLNIKHLSFKNTSDNYLECLYYYTFLRIKFGDSKKYIIVQKENNLTCEFETEPCTKSEGGDMSVRIIVDSPFDLEKCVQYIIREYIAKQKYVNNCIEKGYISEDDVLLCEECTNAIKSEDINDILSGAQERIRQMQEEKSQNIQQEMELKKPRARAVIQMDDNGNIINEYCSISEASKHIGINSKSIREAANGIQKHAGGFCWKYLD